MNIQWNWLTALRVAIMALLPVSLLLAGQVQFGLVMSIGLIPAVLIPLSENRKARLKLLVAGTSFGLAIITGSLLAQIPLLAVVGIAAIAFGAAYLTSTNLRALGGAGMALVVPVVAIGFSYPNLEQAVGLGVIMAIGSLWGLVVALLPWPTKPSKPGAESASLAPRQSAIRYGIVYGLAAAVATAIPLAFGWEHVGWVAGAAMFVMRPNWKVQKHRMWGRLLSVAAGALAASTILAMSPPVWVAGLVVALALVAAGATQGSKWYITPAFSTFIVFFVLLFVEHGQGDIEFRFNERIIETIIGVGVAGLFGLIAKRLTR